MSKLTVLVLGASGMLGSSMMRVLTESASTKVFGTLRSESSKHFFANTSAANIISGIDVENPDSILEAFNQANPNLVINCIGLVKQLAKADDPLQAIPINALLPHRLARLCELAGARLIHISTDCVFSGNHGSYRETDFPDANDLYGRSKYLGEVDYPHAITLRTSIIGHELQSARGLINWFLSQDKYCKGFTKAIFSGLPTVVLAQIIRDVVIPRPDLYGVYHVAAQPITKYDLLNLVARTYGKEINIVPDDQLVIDRSLNADRFRDATGYVAPAWPKLIETMHKHQ